jgi:Uncharacterized ABC-type transport system, permease components
VGRARGRTPSSTGFGRAAIRLTGDRRIVNDLAVSRPAVGEQADGKEAERERASEVLLRIAHGSEERVSVDEILARLDDRSFGFVLLLLGLLACMPQPPGGTIVVGAVMMLIAVQLAVGLHAPWVPGALRRRSLLRSTFRRGIERIAPTLKRAESVCKPRATWLTTGLFERLSALLIVVCGLVIALPIPVIGNVLPGIAVVIMAISLIERDGYMIVAGVTAGLAALALIAGLIGGTALVVL